MKTYDLLLLAVCIQKRWLFWHNFF